MTYYAITNPELQHFGVKGQKWGVRRYQNEDGSLTSAGKRKAAKDAYKQSKKDYKTTLKNNKEPGFAIAGRKYRVARDERNNAKNQAALNVIDKKAQYAASKKKSSAKAEKAEIKSYAKTMGKTGLQGSAKDDLSRGKSTNLYKHLEKTKGREFADKVEKQVTRDAIKKAVLVVGATVATNHYINKTLS